MDENLGIVAAKAVLTCFTEALASVEAGVAKHMCEFALAKIQTRIVSFEEQVFV